LIAVQFSAQGDELCAVFILTTGFEQLQSHRDMGANIYPEDVESIIYSVPLLASSINGFTISLEEDAGGNPRPCFEFELLDSRPKLEVEAMLHQKLSPELAKLSLDYKKPGKNIPKQLNRS
jgi:hypothetical protein